MGEGLYPVADIDGHAIAVDEVPHLPHSDAAIVPNPSGYQNGVRHEEQQRRPAQPLADRLAMQPGLGRILTRQRNTGIRGGGVGRRRLLRRVFMD